MNINERIFNKFKQNSPASMSAIQEFHKKTGLNLRNDYAELLLQTNGGEGFIGQNYLILWPLEKLIELNEAYQVKEYAPGLFLFGSDGGGEAFSFDYRSDAIPLVSVPFVGMDLNSVRYLAANLQGFLDNMLGL
jgi:hypothetical protein